MTRKKTDAELQRELDGIRKTKERAKELGELDTTRIEPFDPAWSPAPGGPSEDGRPAQPEPTGWMAPTEPWVIPDWWREWEKRTRWPR